MKVFFSGWALAAIATVQSGSALTIGETNANNVYGISEDRAQLSGECKKSQLVTGGPISEKLNNYFNTTCFTAPPVIGADGIGTDFGNRATGIVDGPGQTNLDLAIAKMESVRLPFAETNVQLRCEFYNALNHPQFNNPDSSLTSPTFGVISSTAVSPRVIQLALKFLF